MSRWILAAFAVVVLATGCTDQAKNTNDDTAVGTDQGMTFWPPEAGRGTEVSARIDAGSSVFDFSGADLDLGAGITVNSVTVLDGWTATADLYVEPGAELGARTAEVNTGKGVYSIADALTIVDDSFTVTPDRARIGETVEVEIIGTNTEWETGETWANFGDDIEVTSVTILSETYALATVTVLPDAVPGYRDVAMENGPDLTTLYDGFQVDRVALSAIFDPTSVAQGETVEFTIQGSGTHWDDTSEISFWKGGYENGDVVVDSITVVDAENMWGRMTVSNAAETGFRDVMVTTGDEGVFIEDAFEVTDGETDLEDVGISLWFYVAREIGRAHV